MQQLLKFAALVLFVCVVSTGCVSKRNVNSDQGPSLFDGYQSIYRYIATKELKDRGIAPIVSPECIFKIAAESQMEVNYVESIPALYSIKVNYFQYGPKNNVVANLTRSPDGNGDYYFFVPVESSSWERNNREGHFRLVGVVSGSSFRFETVNHAPRIIAQWHMSAQNTVKSVYSWDGITFRLSNKTNSK